jgi:hypothetical protein
VTGLVASLTASAMLAASATFTKTVSGTTTVGAHQLGTPTLSCGGVGVLSVTFNWTAPADTTQSDVYGSGVLASGYELLRGSSPGGPYTSTRAAPAVGTTSFTDSISQGDWYYVVRTTKHAWKGPSSNERHVRGILFLAATCS